MGVEEKRLFLAKKNFARLMCASTHRLDARLCTSFAAEPQKKAQISLPVNKNKKDRHKSCLFVFGGEEKII